MGDDERVAGILADWYDLKDRGVAQEPEEVVRAHPEDADALLAHFAAQAVFDRIVQPPREPEEGAAVTLGEFRILREIGRGGMGVVYEAEQTPMARRVALKVLYPTVTSSPRAVARFHREAQAAGRLHHTNIVPVYSMGEERGVWFYAMEYVPGRPLHQVIEDLRRLRGTPRERMPTTPTTGGFGTDPGSREHYERIAGIFAGVAEGLEAAHEAGIVHRDVKPSNLVLDAEGALRITDFGLARVEGEGATMTLTGDVVGTPAYMSPEQAAGTEGGVDARTDVYSLGATLYEVLTLRPPFRGGSPQEICARIATEDPVAPRRYDARIPRDLETVVQKAMEKERDRRYRSAGDMARDLLLFAEGGAIHARRVGPVGRLVRRVKRHRAVSSLVASVAVLAVAGAFLAVKATMETRARRDLEYNKLCADAEQAYVIETSGPPWKVDELVPPRSSPTAEDLFGSAISVDPKRSEAYFWRGYLIFERPIEKRLSDLDEAHRRGLSDRTWRLARSRNFLKESKPGEAAAEHAAAASCAGGFSPIDLYLEGRILLDSGRPKDGLAKIEEAMRDPAAGYFVRTRGRFGRSFDRERAGDLAGALQDLAEIQSLEVGRGSFIRARIASLWRRLGREDRADAVLRETLEEVRSRGTLRDWILFCEVLGAADEWTWLERSSVEALSAHQDSVALLNQRAFGLMKAGKKEEALPVFEKSRRLDLRNAWAMYYQGLAMNNLGRYEDALAVYDAALAFDSSDSSARCGRARSLQGLKRPREALAELDEAIRRGVKPECAHSAQCTRAWILLDLGQLAESLAASERAIALGSCPSSRRNRIAALEGLGRLEDALQAADEGVKAAPENSTAHQILERLLFMMGRWDKALAEERRSVALDPKDEPAHVRLGYVLLQLQKYGEALAALDEAIRLPPDGSGKHSARSEALWGLGQKPAAQREVEKAIEINVADFRAHFLRGFYLQDGEAYLEAITEFDRAIAVRPDYPEALYYKGESLHWLGRRPEAVAVFQRFLEHPPQDQGPYVADALTILCGDLNSLGRYREAVAASQRCLELPTSDREGKEAHVLTVLGGALNNLGRFEEALPHLDRALQIARDDATAHGFRGYALYYLDRPGEALDAIMQAEALDPSWSFPRSLRQSILQSQGKWQEALALLEDGEHSSSTDAYLPGAMVACLRALGRREEAREIASREAKRPQADEQDMDYAYFCAVAGERVSAEKTCEMNMDSESFHRLYNIACVRAVLGDTEEVLRLLEKAVQHGFWIPKSWVLDPELSSLQGNPRFEDLLRRLRRP